MPLDLSLIAPCYNESTHLAKSAARLLETLDDSRLDYEVVFVDDGSQDDTRDIITEIVAGSDRCRSIFHEVNKGRGAAFKTGFAATEGRVTGFIDIDLEVDPLYIPRLVSLIDDDGYDVATGHRYYTGSQTRTLIRNIMSRGYRWIIRMAIGFEVKDSETGYKFFNRATASDAVLGSKNDGWFWDTEVMARASLANLRIIEFPVLFLRQPEIPSTVKIFRDSRRYLADLRDYRKRAGFSLRRLSPIYWTGVGYDLVMRLLYGRRWADTYRAVADRIPDGVSVVDVCAGTSRIYRDFLHERNVDYVALDFNPHLVMSARRRGVHTRRFDMRTEEIPPADYIVMCSSLYHFRDMEDEALGKLRSAARKAVIVSEPVENLSTDGPSGLKRLLRRLTNPGNDADYHFRYDKDTFEDLAQRHGSEMEFEEGWRNAIAVFSPAD
jgi:glycosyltransferase involved in cell wall biosynthesis